MSEHFCTYFDHRYAAKGLAMWRSLKRHLASANLHVLCLNEVSYEILAGLQLPDVHLHSLKDVEADDPLLVRARANRSVIEYYFTLTPCLPRYIFKTHPQVERLTYVDADLFFFENPRPVLDEIGDNAVALVEHRFQDALEHLKIHGRFNVGWLTFRNEDVAFQCLDTWREQCLEWCHDRVEGGRFAEQKYLDEWPARFPRVVIIQHKGANVAPWNLNRYTMSVHDGQLRIDGDPLIFFHAHGFKAGCPGRSRVLNLEVYGVQETTLLLDHIFNPYESALLHETTQMSVPLALALMSDEYRSDVEGLMRKVVILETELEKSEADRAARLTVIQGLQHQLEESEADRAARLAVIQGLQHQLEESEADRAARRNVIRALRAIAHF